MTNEPSKEAVDTPRQVRRFCGGCEHWSGRICLSTHYTNPEYLNRPRERTAPACRAFSPNNQREARKAKEMIDARDYMSVEDRNEAGAMEQERYEKSRCPTCNSPDPARHPAMQFEGEVQVCNDPFHEKAKN